MNRSRLLHSTADLSVSRFDHPPHESHDDPAGETASRWGIAFVRGGTFDVIIDGARRTVAPGSVFLTRPGLEFQCRHTEECPTDVCISIGFSAAAVGDAEHAWERASWSARASATPRLAYVDRRMQAAASVGEHFESERWALAALTALEHDADGSLQRGRYAARSADVDAVAAASRAIEADPSARIAIADRASDVGMTGTRLTHLFRRYLGVSPHQYVTRARLVAASEYLDAGGSVTDSCYRSGFDNLSHFCRVFQRTFGVRASLWASLPLRERRRKVQALRSMPK